MKMNPWSRHFFRIRNPGGTLVFADGVNQAFHVESIPTILVLDKAGKIAYRTQGFAPDGFADRGRSRDHEGFRVSKRLSSIKQHWLQRCCFSYCQRRHERTQAEGGATQTYFQQAIAAEPHRARRRSC